MGQFSFECVARGVTREELFHWYFDYSEDDVKIIAKRGDGSLLNRHVRKENHGRVLVEDEWLIGGRRVKMLLDATTHQENYTCDVRITVPGRAESHRHYALTEVSEGTRIAFQDKYRILALGLKIADAFGLVKLRLSRRAEQIMKAYVAEAEEELSQRR